MSYLEARARRAARRAQAEVAARAQEILPGTKAAAVAPVGQPGKASYTSSTPVPTHIHAITAVDRVLAVFPEASAVTPSPRAPCGVCGDELALVHLVVGGRRMCSRCWRGA